MSIKKIDNEFIEIRVWWYKFYHKWTKFLWEAIGNLIKSKFIK